MTCVTVGNKRRNTFDLKCNGANFLRAGKYKIKHYLKLHADHLSLQKLNIKTKQYVQNTYLVFIINIYLFAVVDG